MKETIKIMAAVALLCVVSAVSFECGKATKVAKYETYYTATEAVLDSICDDWESFLDVTAETDTYAEYLEAREGLQ